MSWVCAAPATCAHISVKLCGPVSALCVCGWVRESQGWRLQADSRAPPLPHTAMLCDPALNSGCDDVVV